MVAHSDDKRRWNATPEQALMEIKHLQNNWTHMSPGMRANSLKYFANTAALATGDSNLFPEGRKGGELTPGEFFTQLNDVLERWDTLYPSQQREAVRRIGKVAVVTADSMEVGSELAALREEAQQSALGPIVRFQQDVLSAIQASNVAIAAGAKKMAEGAVLVANGLSDVAQRAYTAGIRKINQGLVLCVEGATMVAAALTLGYTSALVGVEGAAEKVTKGLDAFAATCTKAIATVKSLDVSTISYEQVMNAVAPVVNYVNNFAKSAYSSLEQNAVAVESTVKAGVVVNVATLGAVYNAAAAAFTSLVNGFDAASRGMDLPMGNPTPSQVQSAVKNADALSNTLGTRTNEANVVLERASAALADLSAKFIDSDVKSSDLAKVDKAELGAAAKDFTQAVQDGQMASLNQAEVQAAQGQQQSSGRGR